MRNILNEMNINPVCNNSFQSQNYVNQNFEKWITLLSKRNSSEIMQIKNWVRSILWYKKVSTSFWDGFPNFKTWLIDHMKEENHATQNRAENFRFVSSQSTIKKCCCWKAARYNASQKHAFTLLHIVGTIKNKSVTFSCQYIAFQ